MANETQKQQNPQPQASSDLQGQWSEFFRNPAVISGLLQFGATALTPGMGVGPALSQGAQAATRALQFQQQGRQQATKTALETRKVGADERRAAAAERRARAAEIGAGNKQQLEREKLDLQRRRLEEYLKPSLNKRGSKGFDPTRDIFQGYLDQAFNAPFESDLEEDDPLYIEMTEDPVGYALRMNAQSVGGRQSGVGGPPTATGATGAGTPTGPTSATTGDETGGTGSSVGGAPTGAAEPTSETQDQQLDAKGRVRVYSISDEQWQRIFSDPNLEQAAIAEYPEYQQFIKSKKLQLGNRERATVPTGRHVSESLERVMERNQ